MAVSEQIKILCVKLGISVSELARLNETSPQAFTQRMKRESFTPEDLKKIAEAAGQTTITPKGEICEKNREAAVWLLNPHTFL